MKHILKIVKSLEESVLVTKGVSKTIQNEAKEQTGGFIGILLSTLASSLLGSALAAGWGVVRAGEGTIKAGQNFWWYLILILKHKSIIKMSLNLMVFIQETNYWKQMMGIYNKSWWWSINVDLLHSFAC